MGRRLFLLVALVDLDVVSPCGAAFAQGSNELEVEMPSVDARSVALEWTGGAGPYQVQSSESLPAVWGPATEELSGLSVTVPVADGVDRCFYRVVSGDGVIPPLVELPRLGKTLEAASVQGAASIERSVETDVTFTWTSNGDGVQAWWLHVGTGTERDKYYDSGWLAWDQLSASVQALPIDGSFR